MATGATAGVAAVTSTAPTTPGRGAYEVVQSGEPTDAASSDAVVQGTTSTDCAGTREQLNVHSPVGTVRPSPTPSLRVLLPIS